MVILIEVIEDFRPQSLHNAIDRATYSGEGKSDDGNNPTPCLGFRVLHSPHFTVSHAMPPHVKSQRMASVEARENTMMVLLHAIPSQDMSDP